MSSSFRRKTVKYRDPDDVAKRLLANYFSKINNDDEKSSSSLSPFSSPYSSPYLSPYSSQSSFSQMCQVGRIKKAINSHQHSVLLKSFLVAHINSSSFSASSFKVWRIVKSILISFLKTDTCLSFAADNNLKVDYDVLIDVLKIDRASDLFSVLKSMQEEEKNAATANDFVPNLCMEKM